jgi:hypothetical protein
MNIEVGQSLRHGGKDMLIEEDVDTQTTPQPSVRFQFFSQGTARIQFILQRHTWVSENCGTMRGTKEASHAKNARKRQFCW